MIVFFELSFGRYLAGCDYASGDTQLCQLANYPSFIVRLSFVIRSFSLKGGWEGLVVEGVLAGGWLNEVFFAY